MNKDGLHVFHRMYDCFLFVWGRVFVSVCSAFHYLLRIGLVNKLELGTWLGFAVGSGSFGEENLGRGFGLGSFFGSGSRLMSERRPFRHFTGMCGGLNQQNSIWTVKKQQKLGEITKKMVYQPQKWVVSASFSGGFTGKSLFRCSLRRPKRNTAGVAGALIGTALKAAAAAAVAVAWPRVRGVDLVGGLVSFKYPLVMSK